MCSHLDDAIIDANNRLSEIPGIVPSLREFGSNKCLLHPGANIKWNNVGLNVQFWHNFRINKRLHAGKERLLMQADEQDPLLKVRITVWVCDKIKYFRVKSSVKAVDGISFDIKRVKH